MSKSLPPQPNLEHLKKLAKALLKSHQQSQPEAISQIKNYHPRLFNAADADIRGEEISLQDAQLVIAREYGFESWPKLVAFVAESDAKGTESIAADFGVNVRRENEAGVLMVVGYINNAVGEQIATACYELIEEGVTKLVINLQQCKLINSRGVAYLIEVIEKVEDLGGSVGFCNIAPTMAKTFKSMGLLQTSSIYGNEGEALKGVALDSTQAILREQEARPPVQELEEEELQTARQLQMSLMPTATPDIEGLDVAGRCEMANHVGGEFFQYFEQDGKLAICLADVTGHAMEAAGMVMMFSGVLATEMRSGDSLERLFGNLNRTLHHMPDRRTFVCCCMGALDLAGRSLRLANAACPYPYHYCAATGEVVELQVDALPLGARAKTVYTPVEVSLEPGDYVVLCSNGIIEAANKETQMFGFEQTAEVIGQGCQEELSAEALIDRLIGAVQTFAGDERPSDDMTCVVMKVEA